MKFCSKCCSELNDGDFICSRCGATVGAVVGNASRPGLDRVGTAPMVLGIIGIIFGILLPIVTYICSIIGLVLANNEIRDGITTKTTGRVLNVVALCIAGVNSILGVILALG